MPPFTLTEGRSKGIRKGKRTKKYTCITLPGVLCPNPSPLSLMALCTTDPSADSHIIVLHCKGNTVKNGSFDVDLSGGCLKHQCLHEFSALKTKLYMSDMVRACTTVNLSRTEETTRDARFPPNTTFAVETSPSELPRIRTESNNIPQHDGQPQSERLVFQIIWHPGNPIIMLTTSLLYICLCDYDSVFCLSR